MRIKFVLLPIIIYIISALKIIFIKENGEIPMKKVFPAILTILIIISCESTNDTPDCDRHEDFVQVQTNFEPRKVFYKNDKLYAFFSNNYYGYHNDTMYIEVKESEDNGYNWQLVCKIMTDTAKRLYMWSSPNDFLESADGTYWIAGPEGYLFKSADKGATWEPQEQPFLNEYGYDYPIENINEDMNGALFLDNRTYGIFRSADKGENWIHISPRTSIYTRFVKYYGDAIFQMTLFGNFTVSHDNGDSWFKPAGIEDEKMRHFCDYNTDTSIYSSCRGGDGNMYLAISYFPRWEYSYYYKYLLFTSGDKGASWQGGLIEYDQQGVLFTKLLAVDASGNIYASFFNQSRYYCDSKEGIYKSADGGKNWQYIMNMSVGIDPIITKDRHVVYQHCYYEEPKILYVSKDKLY